MSQPLGEVAQQRAAARFDLLGEQAQVVGSAQCPIEYRAGVVELPLTGQAFGQPERAAQKRALPALKAVTTAVPVDQTIAGVELLAHRLDGSDHPVVPPVDELHRRQEQECGVELWAVEALDEDAALAVISATFDRPAQLVAHLLPSAGGSLAHAFVRQPDASVQRR